MTVVYLGIGSNSGHREGHFDLARFFLEKKGVPVRRVSPYYETEALCRPGEEMPRFLNGVFEIETDLSPSALLNLLEEVERNLGRTQKGNWKPRTIDLDILFYGSEVIDLPGLKVPHPEIQNRRFVLKPLSDIAPDFVHPVLKKPIKEILCKSSSTPPT